MAAAAKTGSLMLVGLRSKRTYVVDIYVSDVAAALATFSVRGAAVSTSPTYVTFDEAVMVIDFSIPTGLTDTTAGQFLSNENSIPQIIRWANHVNTLATRPALRIPFNAGRRIGLAQI